MTPGEAAHRDSSRLICVRAKQPLSVLGTPVKGGSVVLVFVPPRRFGRWTVVGVKVERPQRMRGRTTLTATKGHRMLSGRVDEAGKLLRFNSYGLA
jgi:hypothetical protein